MDMSQRIIINQEVDSLINFYLNDISKFGIHATVQSREKLNSIIEAIVYLLHMTHINPHNIDGDSVLYVAECLQTVESFFKMINCQHIFTDTSKEICRIYCQIQNWYDEVWQNYKIPINDVWRLISPVSPDTLVHLGQNKFEASWGCPVPMMDIEILKGTEGISIIKGPYEVARLSAGLATTFVVHKINTT